MRLRQGADAILVGVRTVLIDDPKLTVRIGGRQTAKELRRIILDPRGRTPCTARIVADQWAHRTTVVVTTAAPPVRVARLKQRVQVLQAPARRGRIDLEWLLQELGRNAVTCLLVEGGGETNAHFLLGRLAQRIVFFYAPKLIGGRAAPSALAGEGAKHLAQALPAREVEWRRLGSDLLLTARVD
jgi:diaminohydroxyphosphoribosylaminopyrimidine deaminase/5-amino-6-(5-phosphoribosylamino)uracil reductase